MTVVEKSQDIAGRNETILFVPDDDVIIETTPNESASDEPESTPEESAVVAPVVDTAPWIPLVATESVDQSTDPSTDADGKP